MNVFVQQTQLKMVQKHVHHAQLNVILVTMMDLVLLVLLTEIYQTVPVQPTIMKQQLME
jgi:hypothetical protein